MKSDADILKEFNKNLGKFVMHNTNQRNEIAKCFQYRDGYQVTDTINDNRERLDKRITLINISAPMIRAISGMDIMQEKTIALSPMQDDYDAETDMMGDIVDYIKFAGSYDSEKGQAKEDALMSGLGATVLWLDTTNRKIRDGKPTFNRVYPGFTFYDASARGSDLNERAAWCGYFDPVDSESLVEYIESKGKDPKGTTFSRDFRNYFMSFNRQDNLASLEGLYHYFWYDYDTIHDVENPFIVEGSPIARLIDDPSMMEAITEWASNANVDWKESYWSLDKDNFKALQNVLDLATELLDYDFASELQHSKRQGKCFYRAEIARGQVLHKARSYTQGGHALNFITGYFDETLGIYYGLMRGVSWVQDEFNLAISNLSDYAANVTNGGGSYIKGNIESLQKLAESKAQDNKLTPLPKDAEVIPKALAGTAPQVLLEYARFLVELMPRVIGVSQQLFEIVSGDMTNALYGRIQRQSYAVLASFANNYTSSTKRDGEMMVDLAIAMVRSNGGLRLPYINKDGGETFLRITQDNISDEYSIRVVERPMSQDERSDLADKLFQVSDKAPAALPMAIKYSSLEKEDRDELIQSLTPPPPPPPDPMAQEMLAANIRLTNAQAQQLESKAESERASVIEKQINANIADKEAKLKALTTVAEIKNTQADTALKEAQALTTAQKVEIEKVRTTLDMQAKIRDSMIQEQDRAGQMIEKMIDAFMQSNEMASTKLNESLMEGIENLKEAVQSSAFDPSSLTASQEKIIELLSREKPEKKMPKKAKVKQGKDVFEIELED